MLARVDMLSPSTSTPRYIATRAVSARVCSSGWSRTEEQTLAETARVAMYLGVLVLGLSMSTRASIRGLLLGLASAIAVVSGLAVLSKLVPSWFPADTSARLYATPRLRYPFDYS